MLERVEIQQKLTSLTQFLNELEQAGQYSFQEFQTDFRIRRAIERLLQLVVESAIDINGLLVTNLNEPPPTDYFSSFVMLGRLGVLPSEFAERLAPSTAINNRLVHEYDVVNERLVYASVRTFLAEFGEYVRHIEEYLTSY